MDVSLLSKSVISYFGITTLSLFVYAIPFFCLARFFPSNPNQSFLRRDTKTDIIYYFITGLYGVLNVYAVRLLQLEAYTDETFFSAVTELPVWAQIALLFPIVDFMQYWLHRLFHASPPLWKLHEVHHSPKMLDWLSAARWHPLNHIFYTMLLFDIVFLCGFGAKAIGIYLLLYGINSFIVHANLRWTYGPLRYVFANPIFHRWHHTMPDQGGNKNFAPVFSFFDLIFGTFYMPKDQHPEHFGIETPIAEGFFGQLIHPFRKKAPEIR